MTATLIQEGRRKSTTAHCLKLTFPDFSSFLFQKGHQSIVMWPPVGLQANAGSGEASSITNNAPIAADIPIPITIRVNWGCVMMKFCSALLFRRALALVVFVAPSSVLPLNTYICTLDTDTAHKTNSIIGLCKVTNTCVFFKILQKMSSSLFFLAVSHYRERLIQSRKLLAAPRASYETEDIHTYFE